MAALSSVDLSVRVQQAVVLVVVLAGPVVACLPAGRRLCLAQPARILWAIVIADLGYMLWATIPYVPYGIDESFFLINSYVYTGSDLFVLFVRPPLPGLGAAVFPFHPPLLGLLLKCATAVFTYYLVKRPLGSGYALLAAWLVTVSSLLCRWSSYTLSEPYGAALLTLFALLAARGRGAGLGLLAGVTFLARYPLGLVLPFAMCAGWRRRRWLGVVVAIALFFLPALIVMPLTGADPWQVLMDRKSGYRDTSMLASAWFFLKPGSALGLGIAGMLLAFVGAWQAFYPERRSPELLWSLLIFAAYTGAMIVMGESTLRFFAPLVPLGAVLTVYGCRVIARKINVLQRAPLAGICAGLLAVQIALPVKPPHIRALRVASRGELIRQHRHEILRVIGERELYTDFDFVVLTAILRHPCPPVPQKVSINHKHHPPGLGHLDYNKKFPAVEREALPTGCFYLTYEPEQREVLWCGGDLFLVRW